jgi:GntR family transcriptional regulator, rspAB operon transcriptional repressor
LAGSIAKFAADERARTSARLTTAASRISEALRDRIVTLDLPPGALLSEKELADSFGVSRTPVREALLRLAEDRLVDIYPQSGTFVARISASAARDAMAIRGALERFAVREAARRASADDVGALDRILRDQRAAAADNEIAAFHDADEALHATISVISGHPNVWRVIKREKTHVDRVRLLSLQFQGRFQIVLEEHARIVEAIRAGDADAADAAMEAHLSQVLPSLDAIRETYPTYFETEASPRARRAAKP